MRDRDRDITAFLEQAGWADAVRAPLAGDASVRRYERLLRQDGTAILMDSPVGAGDDPADFVRIALHLRGIGLNAPAILAQNLDLGFLLLEDFGDATFARVQLARPDQEMPLTLLATESLAHLQRHHAAPGIANLSAPQWAEAAMVAVDWYRFAITGDRVDAGALRETLTDALVTHAQGPRVMILRDFHAENLMWLPDRAGLARVGLLDFQLAQMGQPGYDLVSLLQDARRDVSVEVESAAKLHFCAITETDPDAFQQSYAILGIQRALRILGVFARLCLVDGKRGYLAYLPRVWAQLQRNLHAADLAPLRDLCDGLLPAPDAAALEKMARQCARHRP